MHWTKTQREAQMLWDWDERRLIEMEPELTGDCRPNPGTRSLLQVVQIHTGHWSQSRNAQPWTHKRRNGEILETELLPIINYAMPAPTFSYDLMWYVLEKTWGNYVWVVFLMYLHMQYGCSQSLQSFYCIIFIVLIASIVNVFELIKYVLSIDEAF